jgi:hypothetical protein
MTNVSYIYVHHVEEERRPDPKCKIHPVGSRKKKLVIPTQRPPSFGVTAFVIHNLAHVLTAPRTTVMSYVYVHDVGGKFSGTHTESQKLVIPTLEAPK